VNRFPHVITIRLTDEELAMYLRLLQRFGKLPSWTTKSAQFRELVHRLTESMPYETRFDNPGFDSLDDEAEDESSGPDPEVVVL
jgi:hypothetical protein